MRARREQRLVLVEWHDSVQPSPTWRYWTDPPDMEPVKCFSVGWLVKKNRDVVMLAPNVGDLGKPSQQACGFMRIAARSVVSMKDLKAI